MAAHRHIDAICVAIIAVTLLLTILFMNGKALGIQTAASEENSDDMFTENDLNAAWNAESATIITLSDEGSTVSGNGAYVYNRDVYIVYAGKYLLSGELSDGSVIVNADGDDKIWLMLDGVSIRCEDGAALRVEQAGKVFLTLRDRSENILSSGADYAEETVSSGVDGTIYSRDDLTINGSGSLRVTAEYRHGIVCNDDFVMTGGTLNITAAQDAVHANDSVRIRDADLTLSAGDDGITVSNDEETSYIYVESGSVAIPSCREGLEAVQITVSGGTLDISASDDGLNANGYSGNSAINITGGEITVTVENGRDADGIDSNRDIYISGGKLFISVNDSGGSCAIDCGSENGGECIISGGTVLACGSSGMAEGFDSSSPQGFLMQTVSAAAGTTVTVKDAAGNELISEEVPCSFSSVLVSTPDMAVGDTYTLTVGDTETELTIDNASPVGSFGGFGRGGGFGGLGGGQMPNRGFGRDGGMFGGGGMSDRAQDGGTPPEFPANSESGGMPDMPNGADGGTPPEFPANGESGNMPDMPDGADGNMIPPDMPQDGTDGDIPSDPGNMQDVPANGDIGGGTGLPQDGWTFGGRGMRNADGSIPENVSPAGNAETPVSAETLILLAVSAIVLAIGCAAAVCYRRKS